VKLNEIASIPPSYINPSDTYTVRDIHFQIAPNDLEKAVTIWLVGQLDYLDRFGDAHQAGYGRRYLPALIENNLVFDQSTTGLNYDRPLGKHWRQQYGNVVR
jgi:hypothetical protein